MRFPKVYVVLLALGLVLVGRSHAEIIGQWDFSEGSGDVAADSSGNGNDGQFVGDGLTWVAGGLEFDGTSWLDCGPGESLDFSGLMNFSVHAIVEAKEADGRLIIWKGLGCSTWSQWMLGTGEHENSVAVANATFHFRASNGGGRFEARSADPLPTGERIQVAGTYDGEKLRVYVDGALVGETDVNESPWASSENVYIGADPGCSNRAQWNGVIYEIVAFNVTLSDADVSSMAGGLDGSTAVSPAGKLSVLWGDLKAK